MPRFSPSLLLLAVLTLGTSFALLTGCAVVEVPQREGCDNLNPLYCAFPWPSDRYMFEDSDSVTGYGLAYLAPSIPENNGGTPVHFDSFNRFDGFSPASQPLTLFKVPPDLNGAAFHTNIERSLEEDSPTVLIDLTTKERLAHWVELDARAESETATVVVVHPTTRLPSNHSIGVIFRNLTDINGGDITPTASLDALLNGKKTNSIEMEGRREGYESFFAVSDELGIDRATVQQAWWFHTASDESLQSDMLAMLSDALPRLTPANMTCSVDSVEEDFNGNTFRRIKGTFSAPLYMDSAWSPAAAVRGQDDLPEFQGWVEAPYGVLLPRSLAEATNGPEAGPMLQFGHGLMGAGPDEGTGGYLQFLGNELGMVTAATDWAGMSDSDVGAVASGLADMGGKFYFVAERLMEGMIYQVALTRAMNLACKDLPEFKVNDVSIIDPGESYYLGISQGGIYGGTFMTLSPDIERGVLNVPGMAYPLMIDRSVDFYGSAADGDPGYYLMLDAWYDSRVDKFFLMHVVQELWDRSDPSGWVHRTLTDGVLDNGPKKILYQVAKNDAQVPNLSADLEGRTMGLDVIRGSVAEPWGMNVVDAPYDGSGWVEFDMGDPDVPLENLPPDDDYGAHGAVRWTDSAISQMREFLKPNGQITMPCDGTCDPD